jgi:hypothetical protein
LSGILPQTHQGLLCATVSLKIPEAFLNDAKNTSGGVWMDRSGNLIGCELDLKMLLNGKFLAQGGDGGNKAEALDGR